MLKAQGGDFAKELQVETVIVADTPEESASIKQKMKILNLGCGNSVLSEQMYDDGYKSIWNIDYSQSCLDQMSERNATSRPELVWTAMNITDLKYEDEFFDMIIDKSTLDCIVCCPQAFL